MYHDEIEHRLISLGIVLPAAMAPAANYVPMTRSERLVFVSGQAPVMNGVMVTGTVGDDVTEAEAYQAARLAAMNALSVLRDGLGSLARISQILKVVTFVRSAPGFQRQHMVANGASDLLIDVFGARGLHARSAVSSPELPFGICVEVELVVEIVEPVPSI